MREHIFIDDLGKCLYCGALLNKEKLILVVSENQLRCSSCHHILSFKESFGMEKYKGEFKKVFWIDQYGVWTTEKPRKNFKIQDFDVKVIQN